MNRSIARSTRLAVAGWVALAAVLVATPAAAELKPGDPAPAFDIKASLGGKPFNFVLSEALAKGPVVLYFFPKAFTQGCAIEANAFAQAHDDYQALGATVIGVSGDDIDTLNKFSVLECRDRFAVGADRDGRVMKAYDAAMPNVLNFARRVSYVISPQSRIVYSYASSGPDQHVPNTLQALRQWKAQGGR